MRGQLSLIDAAIGETLCLKESPSNAGGINYEEDGGFYLPGRARTN